MQTTLFKNEKIDELIAIAKSVDRVSVAMSGGKDSSVAAFWAITNFPGMCELVYVDTGVELPDVVEYVYDFARRFDTPIHQVRGETFFEKYGKNQAFPAPQHRSCVPELIFAQIDEYNVSRGDSFVLCTGAQRAQSQLGSSTDTIMEKTCNKKTFKIINPFYATDYADARRDFLRVYHFWNGYKLGFDRTACWCCPFQRPSQYDALKKYYPILFDRLMSMAETWQTHDSDLERYYIKKFGAFEYSDTRPSWAKSPAQNTVEICHTAPNSAMPQGLKPHAGNTGTSA